MITSATNIGPTLQHPEVTNSQTQLQESEAQFPRSVHGLHLVAARTRKNKQENIVSVQALVNRAKQTATLVTELMPFAGEELTRFHQKFKPEWLERATVMLTVEFNTPRTSICTDNAAIQQAKHPALLAAALTIYFGVQTGVGKKLFDRRSRLLSKYNTYQSGQKGVQSLTRTDTVSFESLFLLDYLHFFYPGSTDEAEKWAEDCRSAVTSTSRGG
ncbi:hypothetical protein M231_06565 [Tremella mesenterica]|uniref:Uncharacterized protein n=1 Tax=Tremella mesenterica TaxID=5217 RepID=A0A4V1M3A2_TREME|nr:hypothetical protein M231_06565 [Tremella mesenterica]